tara:strand:- start:64 stop:288 length:225 start_codon:yes stop_codon:yes gene_type:complete
MNGETQIKVDLQVGVLEEIISILAMHGRPDLISEIRLSQDAKPKKKTKKTNKEFHEYYDESDISVDEDGFWSLK